MSSVMRSVGITFGHNVFPIRALRHNGQRPFIIAQSFLPDRTRNKSSSASPVALNRHRTSRINGPSSTLPPPLVVPNREPNQSLASYLLAAGRAYLAFYKTGGKAVFSNFLASRPVRATIHSTYNGSLAKAIDAGILDRSDFQLLIRSRFDIKRLPVFALVFIVCGELMPLVVIALTDIVPYTCRIPRQIEGDRKMLEKRRAISFQEFVTVLPGDYVNVEGLNRMQLLHINRSLGLSSTVWFGGQILGLPTPLLRRRVRRTVEYLDIDDKLILKCGGVQNMDMEEIRIALVERGIDISGKTERHLKDSMKAWLYAREEVPIESLLLTRPPSWPQKTH